MHILLKLKEVLEASKLLAFSLDHCIDLLPKQAPSRETRTRVRHQEEEEEEEEEREGGRDPLSQLLLLLRTNVWNESLDRLMDSILVFVRTDLEDEWMLSSTATPIGRSSSSSLDIVKGNRKFKCCFSIHSNLNGLLDVARKVYLATLEDMYKLASVYQQTHDMQVKVVYSASRGYHLSLPSTIEDLPDEFVQAVMNKVHFSSF